MSVVAVIDYGMSNLHSVARALEHVAAAGQEITVTGDPAVVAAAGRVVFPGQGAIGGCMDNLARLGLDDTLRTAMHEKPFLGICLGLQSLLDASDEDGGTPGFGFIPGRVERFPEDLSDRQTGERLKVPHMGWNQVRQRVAHPLWDGIADNAYFYFVHSYVSRPDDPGDAAGTTEHGIEFCSAAARGNVFAVQFHPEKSQHAGLRLLHNFLRWDGAA